MQNKVSVEAPLIHTQLRLIQFCLAKALQSYTLSTCSGGIEETVVTQPTWCVEQHESNALIQAV